MFRFNVTLTDFPSSKLSCQYCACERRHLLHWFLQTLDIYIAHSSRQCMGHAADSCELWLQAQSGGQWWSLPSKMHRR